MADEPVVETETEPVTDITVDAVQETVQETVHPLKPGGARFEEVYARMKQAEDRVARVEGMYQQALNQQRPQPQGPQGGADGQGERDLLLLLEARRLVPEGHVRSGLHGARSLIPGHSFHKSVRHSHRRPSWPRLLSRK